MNTHALSAGQTRPWYREAWLWFVIALPFSAVVAGIATVIIANSGSDSLVVDDFKKVGLVAHRETALERGAATREIVTTISVDRDAGQLIVRLEGDTDPQSLSVNFFHPTRNDLDRNTTLVRDAAGLYRGNIGADLRGHWYVQIADDAGEWRVTGRLNDDAALVNIRAD